MFTGIIEELGDIKSFSGHAKGARIVTSATVVNGDAKEGDSISVNGVCLTALDISPVSFAADVSQETLDCSTLGSLNAGSSVNLERSVTPTTRLGGHIVQGHVDGTGKFIRAVREGDFWTIRFSFPSDIGQYLVYKGSIAVEGISLTIAKLEDEFFEVAIIPKTWEVTNLSKLNAGDGVNLEVDVIAKYVERMMLFSRAGKEKSEGITMEKLQTLGFN